MMKVFMGVVKRYAINEGYWEDCKDKREISHAKLLWEKVGVNHLIPKFSEKKQ